MGTPSWSTLVILTSSATGEVVRNGSTNCNGPIKANSKTKTTLFWEVMVNTTSTASPSTEFTRPDIWSPWINPKLLWPCLPNSWLTEPSTIEKLYEKTINNFLFLITNSILFKNN